MTRLDKILSTQLNISRTDAKQMIKKGRVSVNGIPAKSGDVKVADADIVAVDGNEISYSRFVYIMMNKPKGVISASDGKGEKTVVDLVPSDMQRRGLFPAGRLDKDTTGFVLLTDDGEFAHSILAPSRHIDKTYVVTLDKPVTSEVVQDFRSGMELNGERLLQADVEIISEDATVCRVVLRQGLYHQIKRMFKKHGLTVVELKRVKMGNLPLDDSLLPGECRYLSQNELDLICSK
ncbi:pseudouridine synthase [uncultured Eubacterium sp.]|uniref:pseudouridine synthase n=1 Tax=uncultured Eubacterium sp. TaxID=165185 RepID=UPI0015BDEF02|nr:pseudouridine synthase [uncultured Eubacterium sp.]